MTEPYRIKKPATLAEIPHDNHVVIEASAGTGKTYTIEHMVVDLLLADADLRISQILIVTFTERATHELSTRIRRLVQAIVDADTDLIAQPYEPAWEIDSGRRRRLQRALSAFDRAPIHTIHGFCHRVLTEHAFQNHCLFDQEHIEFDTIFDRVFKRALRREFAHNPRLLPYLQAWMEANDPAVDQLQRILGRCVRSRADIQPTFDERRLADALDAFGDLEVDTIVDRLDDELSGAGVHHSTIRATIRRIRQILAGLVSYRHNGQVVDFLAAAGGGEVYDYLHEKLEAYDFGGPMGRLIRRAFEAVVPLEAAVVGRFLPVVERMLAEYKHEEGHFSYDDMLSFVWDSMRRSDGTELVEVLRNRYKYALIDEFQDTDDLQWNIFRRIFHDSDRENIFYLIGDPKQAIYSFRGADVYTYLDAKQTVLDNGGTLVRLETNYRSSRPVVSAYNRLFDQSVEPAYFSGDIRYDRPVDCARQDWKVFGADGTAASPVQLVHLVDPDLDAERLREGFAAYFAAEIDRLLSDAPLTVREDAISPPRTISAGDIFVLTRSRSEGRYIAEHLQGQGVPHAFFKQDGLFQTAEALHVYDLLEGVAHPYDRSKRMGAWLTPFFGLELDDLPGTAGLAETDPLMGDLLDWKASADKRWFETLFSDILSRSGLLRHEIFARSSQRQLTNYLHIFEVLLEEAHWSGYGLDELTGRLKAFIDGRHSPHGEDGNVQRLESDRDAVQIMTMHKSKGLEADVVFIYGGFGRPPSSALHAFHDRDGQSVLHIGSPPDHDKQACSHEQAEEEQRLMYVALTRARSQIYLPYVGFEQNDDDRDYPIRGAYRALMPRLDSIVAGHSADPEPVDSPYFDIDRVEYAQTVSVRDVAAQRAALAKWSVPNDLPAPFEQAVFEPLWTRRHLVTSYSRIKHARSDRTPAGSADRQPDGGQPIAELAADGGPSISELLADDALPGGRQSGIFLHELVETLDLPRARRHHTVATWLDDPHVDRHIRTIMRRYGIARAYLKFCKRLVFRSVTTPLKTTNIDVPCVADCDRVLRELEFLYPIPESSHPTIADIDADHTAGFQIERGYIKGFVDLLLEDDSTYFFADWKSDILPEYTAEAVDTHVLARYQLQAKLYALAVVKFLEIHDQATYRQRFGGYFYLFMRGMAAENDRGVYFQRPRWKDICRYEAQLRNDAEFSRA